MLQMRHATIQLSSLIKKRLSNIMRPLKMNRYECFRTRRQPFRASCKQTISCCMWQTQTFDTLNLSAHLPSPYIDFLATNNLSLFISATISYFCFSAILFVARAAAASFCTQTLVINCNTCYLTTF